MIDNRLGCHVITNTSIPLSLLYAVSICGHIFTWRDFPLPLTQTHLGAALESALGKQIWSRLCMSAFQVTQTPLQAELNRKGQNIFFITKT